MKKIGILIVLSLLITTLITFSPLYANPRGIRVMSKSGQSLYLYKDYYALVIGVSNYQKWPRLPYAVSDAREVAHKLEGLGFGVKLVLDPTAREMEKALNELVYDLGEKENRALLLYYAGHGETERLADGSKMGYLIPRDCPLLKKDRMGFADHAISMGDIESVSLRIRSKHVLMLFDSCFSGSLFNMVRAAPDDISEKSALPVRQYITAGKEDEQVPDKSLFKRSFLIGLEGDADLTGDGYVTGSELGMYLSDKVVNYTHRGQHPQYGKINNPNLDRGDFVFVPLSPEAKLKAMEDRMRKLSEENSSLREELKRLREAKSDEPEKIRVAVLPKEVKEPAVRKVKLRSRPKQMGDSDVKEMVNRLNFYARKRHAYGGFPNDFVDNGNGTITDRATGLMWEKAGSPLLSLWQVERYLSKLNEHKFSGYDDWRIPTLEEISSLLEPKANQSGQYISPLFSAQQSKCWTADIIGSPPQDSSVRYYRMVDFANGDISYGGNHNQGPSDQFFIRAVRTLK